SWYPDSKTLLVSGSQDGKRNSCVLKLRKGENAEYLFPLPLPFLSMPRVSPNGDAVAWSDRSGLHIHQLHDGVESLILPATQRDVVLLAVWSPDGGRLAFVRMLDLNRGPQFFIETTDRSGSQRHLILGDPRLLQDSGDSALGWAPDGRLVFGTAQWPPEEPGTTLWTIPLDARTGEATGDKERIGSWTTSIGGNLTASTKGSLAMVQYAA